MQIDVQICKCVDVQMILKLNNKINIMNIDFSICTFKICTSEICTFAYSRICTLNLLNV